MMLKYPHYLILQKLMEINEIENDVDKMVILNKLVAFHTMDKQRCFAKDKLLTNEDNNICISFYKNCIENILGVEDM